MQTTIYVDVLLAVNIFINYFLLLATAKFLGIPKKQWRLAAGAVLGAIYALQILLPSIPVLLNMLVKLVLSATIVLAAFPIKSWKMFGKSMGCFYAMNFSFAGFFLAVWYFMGPPGLVIKNSVVYVSISPILLIVTTVVCYIILRLIFRMTGKQENRSTLCTLNITYDSKTVSCTARIDTGNSLVEPFSHNPVAVVEYEVLKSVLPEEMQEALQSPANLGVGSISPAAGIRMVPFHSIAGEGVLPAFRPESCIVDCGKQKVRPNQIYIAVCNQKIGAGEFSALLNPELLAQEVL